MQRRSLFRSLIGGLFSGRMLPVKWQAKPDASPLVSNQYKVTFDCITIPSFTKDVLELRTVCDSIETKPVVSYRDSKNPIIEATPLIQVARPAEYTELTCTILPGEVDNATA